MQSFMKDGLEVWLQIGLQVVWTVGDGYYSIAIGSSIDVLILFLQRVLNQRNEYFVLCLILQSNGEKLVDVHFFLLYFYFVGKVFFPVFKGSFGVKD